MTVEEMEVKQVTDKELVAWEEWYTSRSHSCAETKRSKLHWCYPCVITILIAEVRRLRIDLMDTQKAWASQAEVSERLRDGKG